MGALLAASTGVVGATVVTMGLLSLPAMMRAGYDPKLATGVICASGTLGQIIPPSVILIFVGDLLMGANQLAAQRTGKPLDPVSVGDLFIGAFIPGCRLVGALHPLHRRRWPRAARGLPGAADGRRGARLARPPLPAGAGAAARADRRGAGLDPGRLRDADRGGLDRRASARWSSPRFNRAFSFGMLLAVMRNTAVISALVFAIVLGVSVFSLVFRGLGGEHLVEQILADVPGGAFGAVMAVMVVMFVLGFFMDTIEIVLIVVPITAPVIIAMGVDPVWLGVMIGVNLQTAFLTPPVGFSLFYMRAVAPASITTGDIYRGIIPFVCLQVVAIAILWMVPELATWLPKQVFPDAVPADHRRPAGLGAGRHPQGAADGAPSPSTSGSPLDQTAQPAGPEHASRQRSHPRPPAGHPTRAAKGPASPPALADVCPVAA